MSVYEYESLEIAIGKLFLRSKKRRPLKVRTSVTALMLAFREPEKPPMSLDFARWVLAVCEARLVVSPEDYALAQRARATIAAAEVERVSRGGFLRPVRKDAPAKRRVSLTVGWPFTLPEEAELAEG